MNNRGFMSDSIEDKASGLAEQYFSPNKYGPHIQCRAHMLAIEAYNAGLQDGQKVAELAQRIKTDLM
jgi:hypothetical protein